MLGVLQGRRIAVLWGSSAGRRGECVLSELSPFTQLCKVLTGHSALNTDPLLYSLSTPPGAGGQIS